MYTIILYNEKMRLNFSDNSNDINRQSMLLS